MTNSIHDPLNLLDACDAIDLGAALEDSRYSLPKGITGLRVQVVRTGHPASGTYYCHLVADLAENRNGVTAQNLLSDSGQKVAGAIRGLASLAYLPR